MDNTLSESFKKGMLEVFRSTKEAETLLKPFGVLSPQAFNLSNAGNIPKLLGKFRSTIGSSATYSSFKFISPSMIIWSGMLEMRLNISLKDLAANLKKTLLKTMALLGEADTQFEQFFTNLMVNMWGKECEQLAAAQYRSKVDESAFCASLTYLAQKKNQAQLNQLAPKVFSSVVICLYNFSPGGTQNVQQCNFQTLYETELNRLFGTKSLNGLTGIDACAGLLVAAAAEKSATPFSEQCKRLLHSAMDVCNKNPESSFSHYLNCT
eukprot:GCRY01005925.1.p2 GENE.GCRY01005925.1~~GCRY01005925.1.p2  ORF type:complete len:266 (-),score=36.63 GCRY01005925.1:1970-2767(-)